MSAEHVVSRLSTPIKVESTPPPETAFDVVKRKEDASAKRIASKYFTAKKEGDEKPLKSEVRDRCLKTEDDGATKEERASVERNEEATSPRRIRNVHARYRAADAGVIDLVSEDEKPGSGPSASPETTGQPRAPNITAKRKTSPIPDMPRRTSGRAHRAVRKVQHDSDDFEDSPEPVNERRHSKKQRLKRGYAPPEVYAHLNYVQDNLDYDLNILFCGINPGQKSAGEGHHFANPRNGFWKCLHQGGLTDAPIPPSEDHTLPERFRLGIINLIDRPSAEMNELSMAERRAAVPGFLRKVHKWRPKIVCMVGKGIWEDVYAYAAKASKGNCAEDGIRVERCLNEGSSGSKDLAKLKDGFEYDIQPICLPHDSNKGAKTKRTLFFVVPSTSGRVLTHQLPDKVLLFQLLRKRWEELEAGRMTKSVEWEIRIDGTT